MGSVIAGVFFWVRGNPDITSPRSESFGCIYIVVVVVVVAVAVCPQAVCRGVELSSQHPPRQCNVLAALLAISATEAHSYCAIVSEDPGVCSRSRPRLETKTRSRIFLCADLFR